MRLASPVWLLALVPVALLVVAYLVQQRRRQRPVGIAAESADRLVGVPVVAERVGTEVPDQVALA